MAFGDQPEIKHQDSLNKTARGFVKAVQKQAVVLAKGLQGKSAVPNVKNDEQAFFKKKVRLNTVEKKVHQFQLD